MEPDTMPYDADATAWEAFQVPQAEPVPAVGFPAVQHDSPTALAPTIPYDTAGDFALDIPPAPEAPAASDAPTIAYEMGGAADTLAYEIPSPGGLPKPWRAEGHSAASPEAPTIPAEPEDMDLAPTLVLDEPADVLAPSAPSAPSLANPADHHGAGASSPQPSARTMAPPPSPARGEWLRPLSAKPAVASEEPKTPPRATPPRGVSSPKEAVPVTAPAPPVVTASPEPQTVAETPSASSAAVARPPEVALETPSASSAAVARPPEVALETPSASSAAVARPPETGTRAPERPAPQRLSCDGLVARLVGKQAPPAGYQAPPKAAPKPRAKPQKEEAASSSRRRPSEPLRPVVGCKVMVKGDGWGGGTGEYKGTVIELDDITFSVVFQNDDKKWEETQVLREHCQVIESEEVHKRRRT